MLKISEIDCPNRLCFSKKLLKCPWVVIDFPRPSLKVRGESSKFLSQLTVAYGRMDEQTPNQDELRFEYKEYMFILFCFILKP